MAWTAADNLHVTLKFLGNVDESRIHEIGAALRSAVTVPAFEVGIRGLGAFPTATRARVLWAGAPGSAPFTRLAGEVDRALEALGFPPEGRPFTAHVTLGRVRAPRSNDSLAAALESSATKDFGTIRVDRVSLMRSDLSPRGARYTELGTAPLQAR